MPKSKTSRRRVVSIAQKRKSCKAKGKVLSKKSKRCIKSKRASKVIAKKRSCRRSGLRFNPSTGRCIKTGPIDGPYNLDTIFSFY